MANDNYIPPTGELKFHNDSITIAYEDLKIANAKMIELDYQKEINKKLYEIIDNDNQIITKQEEINNNLNNKCKKYIKQRNVTIGIGSSIIVSLIMGIIFLAK